LFLFVDGEESTFSQPIRYCSGDVAGERLSESSGIYIASLFNGGHCLTTFVHPAPLQVLSLA